MLKKLRTYLGRVIRDIGGKIEDIGARSGIRQVAIAGAAGARAKAASARPEGLFPAYAGGRVHWQRRGSSAHEFGVKVSIATTLSHASSRF
jgi:IS5 family transposase